jgi:hypothetical protein
MMMRFCGFVCAVLFFSGTASAATIPLGSGQTFNQACTAAAAGDTITVPTGSYSSQTVTCTKAVTFQGAGKGNTVVAALNVNSGANGPTFDGMTFTGGASVMNASNITIRNSALNNQTYLEGVDTVMFHADVWEPKAGGSTWGNGDMVDIYEQTRSPGNKNITIEDSILHGLRSPSSTAHPDAIQFCNCDGTAGDSKHAVNVKILRNRFYDNECMNLRANPDATITLENNVFGDSVTGISGCGFYALDPSWANVTARYNSFPGGQQIQGANNPPAGRATSTYVGNAFNGFNNGCSGGGSGSTFSYNVTTGSTCSSTDKHVTSLQLNSDGSPKTGSPVIDAGSPTVFPAKDIVGTTRPQGAFADAGAYEVQGIDTTAPDTTITNAPTDGTSTDASISFTSSETGSTFECKLDDGVYGSCTSPKTYSNLSAGSHTFSVRATDSAGNTDSTPASTTWTVNTTDPCQSVKDDLATMTASRDAWKARAEAAEAKLAQIHDISAP